MIFSGTIQETKTQGEKSMLCKGETLPGCLLLFLFPLVHSLSREPGGRHVITKCLDPLDNNICSIHAKAFNDIMTVPAPSPTTHKFS